MRGWPTILPRDENNDVLSPYRVLDLTDERGLLAGQILADLGADVIQVEPPGGSPARAMPPWLNEDAGDPQRSAYWVAYARNKRGITLDLERPEGQALLRRLTERADFLIESAGPGVMAARGLGYEDLARVNPRLVYVSITPFGPAGPKAHYADSEIVLWAAGGPLLLTGEPDRPPLRVSVPQAYLHAAGDAAGGALVAHFARVQNGTGQHVEISVQRSVMQATLSQALASSVDQPEAHRSAGATRIAGVAVRMKWPTADDGFMELTLGMGTATGHFTNRLLGWIVETGGADESVARHDWREMPALLGSGEVTVAEFEAIHDTIEAFIARRTRAELMEESAKRQLLMTSVATVPELAESPHLAARAFWQPASPDATDGLRYPGPAVKVANRPISYRRAAPLPGEHNHAVYVEELGLSEEEFAQLQAGGVI